MIDILDVPVTVGFGEAVGGTGRDVVQVWEDASGRMRFTAPPERRPFFAAMKYDQLPAQAEWAEQNTNGPDCSGPRVKIAPNGACNRLLLFLRSSLLFRRRLFLSCVLHRLILPYTSDFAPLMERALLCPLYKIVCV